MEDNFEFYASIGDVHTTQPWGRPNIINLEAWWNEWKEVKGLYDYEVYLSGALAEQVWGNYKGMTWDVDIILIGDVKDTKEFKHIMDEGYRIGWANRLCMDMFHSTDMDCCLNTEFKPFKLIRNGSSFIKRSLGETHEVPFSIRANDVNELENGLFEFIYTQPNKMWDKVQNRIKTGEYIGVYKKLKDIFS
jgi:hypothetical protein